MKVYPKFQNYTYILKIFEPFVRLLELCWKMKTPVNL